jgi:hypothetical protein
MALPKKHGLRTILVGPAAYYWKVRQGEPELEVTVGKVTDQNCRLTVLTPWVERQLLCSGQPYVTGIITPALVREAIDYALLQGWGKEGNRRLVLNYQDETFSIRTPFTNSI